MSLCLIRVENLTLFILGAGVENESVDLFLNSELWTFIDTAPPKAHVLNC